MVGYVYVTVVLRWVMCTYVWMFFEPLVVFSDYEEYDSKFKNEKAKLKSDLEKKKLNLKPVNYMILDPICTTFDPEESLKQ